MIVGTSSMTTAAHADSHTWLVFEALPQLDSEGSLFFVT